MHCFVVCDGLGGHGMGDAASKLVVNVFGALFEQADDASSFLPRAFETAQEALMDEQKRLMVRSKMKTTCAALVTDTKHAYMGYIGDSRLYVFGKNKILYRSLDHSVPQMLVLSKEIKESEIRKHPDRNIVLRVMGVKWNKPEYELMPRERLKRCKAFLLCTDGFWELIREEEMCVMLKQSSSAEEWLNRMTEAVEKNGVGISMDNYSAIAIWTE